MNTLRSRSGKLPIVAVIAAALVLALGAGAFAFLRGSHKGKPHPKKEHVKVVPWEIGEFLVNLADPGDPRYLKVNLVLDVAEGKKKGGGGHGGEAANPEEAKARDAIFGELSKRRMSDLLTDGGKDALKSDIKSALNEALEETEVVSIYFTSFAMQ